MQNIVYCFCHQANTEYIMFMIKHMATYRDRKKQFVIIGYHSRGWFFSQSYCKQEHCCHQVQYIVQGGMSYKIPLNILMRWMCLKPVIILTLLEVNCCSLQAKSTKKGQLSH